MISILMANYNNGKYIEEAILSVINQTSKDWELIIIDDCSKDNSEKVIKKYLRDKRIKYFRNESNRGYIDTLRRLINKASYDIVGILDSDDVLEKTAIEKVLQAYQKHTDCGFVYTQYVYCDENLNEIKIGDCKPKSVNDSEIFGPRTNHFKTFNKHSYYKTSGYDEEIIYAEDKDLILKMEEVTKFYFINEVLYRYRRVANSQTSNPIKLEISRASYELAKYRAYLRRLDTNLPNLSSCQMSYRLLDAIPSCLKAKDRKRFNFFMLTAFKLCPINLLGCIMLSFRLIKFPFYRFYKYLRPKNDPLLGA